jgi:F-type H+-transporting ATPase subunit b
MRLMRLMRRVTLVLAFGLAFAFCALPQETRPATANQQQEGEQGDPWIWWKWANFLILAAGLGYLINKHAPPFFAQRAREIEESLLEAAKAKQDAEARAASIDKRLADLDREIEGLRQAARAETAAEGERLRRESEQHLQRIQQQTGQEIELMINGARHELRKYAALLALDLAEQRIHSRLTKDVQEELMDGFLQDLRMRVKPGVTAER